MSIGFKLRQKFLEKTINFYGPFVGAGVKLKHMSKDFRDCEVEMKLTFYNKNYMGTQFGGSLYAMTDPWYMLMLIKNLGEDYIVWDKGATINFRKPGRGTVRAEFQLTEEVLEDIRATVAAQVKMDKVFKVEIKDESGKLIADVDKVLYIRKKS
jgi:acyl-coenzyme A thioesterase PaaI-like protein